MSNIDQGLEVRITTPADTTGADATTSAVTKVAKAAAQGTAVAKENAEATKKQGDAAKGAGRDFLDQGEAMSQAAAGGRVLTEVSHGNVAALLQLGSVVKATKAALSTTLGVVGVLLAAGTAAISKIQEEMAKKRENQLKLEADKATVAFNAAQAAADRLNQQTTDAFAARLKAIDDAASRAVDRVQRLVDIAAKLDDVEKATQLAAIDADQSLTAEQKLNAKAEVNNSFASRAENRQRQVEDTQAGAAQGRFDDTVRATAAARAAANRARTAADATSGASLLELMKPLERQLAEMQKANPGADVSIPALDRLRERFAATQTDEGKQRAAIAAAEAAAREADLKAAKEREAAAKQTLRELEKAIADERTGREQIAAAQAKQDKRKYNLDLQDARKADEAAAPRPAPAPDPRRDAPLVTNTGEPVPQPDAAQAARNRAGAVANVAGGIADNVANDTTQGEALRALAAQAAAAAKAAESDQSAANITKAIQLMQDLATALVGIKQDASKQAADSAARLAKVEGDIRLLKR